MKLRMACALIACLMLLGAMPTAALASGLEGEGVTLTHWTVNNDTEIANQQAAIQQFMDETGAKVEVSNSFSGWPDFWTKLMTSIAGGTAPDVIRMKETHTAELHSRGALLNLTDYIAQDPNTNPEDYMDAMWQTVSFDDGVYALPMLGSIIVLFYNVDLFNAAGYTRPPETWEELREYAINMTDLSKDQYGFMWYELGVREPCFAWWYGFYLMAGGELWKDGVVGSQVQLNNEAGLKALNLQLDMLYNDKSAVPPSVAATSLAENGKVAMWMQGSWNFGTYPTTAPNLNWATALLPGDVNRAHNALVDNLGVVGQTKYPDLAYKLASMMASVEGDYTFNATCGYMPTHKSNAEREPYTTNANYALAIQAYTLPETQPKPLCPGYEEMGVALATELQKAWFNQVSAEECLAEAEIVANAILDRVNGR